MSPSCFYTAERMSRASSNKSSPTTTWSLISKARPIEVQDKKVLCKILDLDFFVNLYFMRWGDLVFGNKENDTLAFLWK